MLLRLLRLADQVLDYDKPGGPLSQTDPRLVLTALLTLWTALIIATPTTVLLPFTVALLIHSSSGKERVAATAKASLYPTILVTLTGLLLAPLQPLTREWAHYGLLLALRTYGIASTALLVLGELGPHGIQCALARASLLHDTTLLLYRIAPQTIRDLLTAFWAQKLIGKTVKDALTGASLSTIRRAEQTRTTLFLRGAKPGRRAPLCLGYSRELGLLILGGAVASFLTVILLELLV